MASIESNAPSQPASANTSFKAVGIPRPVPAPQTPNIQFGKEFPLYREKPPSSRNSSSLSIKSPGAVSVKRAEDPKVRVGSKSGHRNPLEKVIPREVETKTQEIQIPAADVPAKASPPADKPTETSGQSSLQTAETQLPPAKPESKGEDPESFRQMMTPPLVIFGGQNAVRLDPLLTRKSQTRSGSVE